MSVRVYGHNLGELLRARDGVAYGPVVLAGRNGTFHFGAVHYDAMPTGWTLCGRPLSKAVMFRRLVAATCKRCQKRALELTGASDQFTLF